VTSLATTTDDVYARLLDDLIAIVPITAGAPNILARVYGARMCDKAINVSRAVDRLIIGLADGLTDSLWRTRSRTCHDHSYRNCRTRESLRAAAGEPPLGEYAISRGYYHRGPPLSAAEHVQFGADLAAVRDALTHAEIAITQAGGKRRDDLLSLVRKAQRVLQTLRSNMDTVVQREWLKGIGGRVPAAVYTDAQSPSSA
jgi:hypothetical protein